jgi:AcrR family transcriptional regulator
MSAANVQPDRPRPVRKRRSDGERSRNAILHEAARLATTEGISGLSIGRLADAVGMSKSGLFAHFGSKLELQLATMEAASTVFTEHVLEPALLEPTPFGRLRRLAENYLLYVEGATFPGGCFFASVATEVDTHPGPVRDVALQVLHDWLALLAGTIRDAQADGSIAPEVDPEQLAFEIEALLFFANTLWVISPESKPTDRARTALARRFSEIEPHAAG